MAFLADASTSSSAPFRPTAEEQANATQVTFVKSVAGASPSPNRSLTGATASAITYSLPRDAFVVRWSPYLESQFQELVALRADKKATPQDLVRLDRIRGLRQRFKSPIEASQLLHDFKARELRKNALAAVNAYVQFFKNT